MVLWDGRFAPFTDIASQNPAMPFPGTDDHSVS